MNELVRVKVVEIFFEEDPTQKGFLQALPCFLLENGQIKRGVMVDHHKAMWITDYEYDESKKRRIVTPDFIKIEKIKKK